MPGRRLYLRIRNHALRAGFRLRYLISKRADLTRLGSDYGGYLVPLALLDAGSICYSGGVGEDTTFDESLIDAVGCDVYAFDPTPRAITHAAEVSARDPRFHFMPVGLWSVDTSVPFFVPADPSHVSHSITNLQRTDTSIEVAVRKVQSLMHELSHAHLDLLKLDIEGAEHEVIASILSEGIFPRIICVEFDQPAAIGQLRRSMTKLRRAGYELVGAEGWNHTFVRNLVV